MAFLPFRIFSFKLSILCAVLLLCRTNYCIGQEQPAWSGFGIEGNVSGGRLIKHTTKIKGPVPENSYAAEINLVQQLFGKKPWHQRWNYPLAGVAFSYTDYGLDSVYGKCIAIYPNLQIPIIRSKNLEWTLRVGFGLGYATRKYERFPSYDTTNTAIGSNFNNFTTFNTDLRYHLNKHIDIQVGANFSHMSNAAFKQPNLGLNMYGAHIGIRYYPVTSRPEKIVRKLKPLKNRWLVQGRVGFSLSEAGFADGPTYPVYLASAYASKRYLSKHKAFIGIDYSYHTRIEAFLKNNYISPQEAKNNSWKSAVFVGNEFLLGRVGIMLQVGVYLKDATLRMDPYYEKLGANFYLVQQERGLIKEMFFSCLLKTHKTQAELVELGLGFGF